MTTQEIASTIYIKLLDCIDRTKAGDWEDVVAQCEEIAQLASKANQLNEAEILVLELRRNE